MSRNSCSGISLIELLISLLLSSLLLLSVMELLAHTQTSYHKQTQKLTQLQTERYVAYRISNAIRQAGFLGCGTFNTAKITNQITNSQDTLLGVAGYTITPNQSVLPDILAKQALPGSQALVLQTLSAPTATLTQTMLTTDSALRVNQVKAFAKNDHLMIADCEHADLFTASSVSKRNLSLSHTASNNRSNALSHIYAPPAEIGQWVTTLFYIRKATTKKEDSSSLFMAINNYSNEIASNVTQLALRFRVTTQSGLVAITAVSQWHQVTGVEVTLTYQDSHTQTIFTSLRNR